MQKKHYIAKYNRVWQNKKTGVLHGNSVTLNGNERITDYIEIPKPPIQQLVKAKKTRGNKKDGRDET